MTDSLRLLRPLDLQLTYPGRIPGVELWAGTLVQFLSVIEVLIPITGSLRVGRVTVLYFPHQPTSLAQNWSHGTATTTMGNNILQFGFTDLFIEYVPRQVKLRFLTT